MKCLNKNEFYPPWTIAFQPPQFDDQPTADRGNHVTQKESNSSFIVTVWTFVNIDNCEWT